jgi:hypothetical protein
VKKTFFPSSTTSLRIRCCSGLRTTFCRMLRNWLLMGAIASVVAFLFFPSTWKAPFVIFGFRVGASSPSQGICRFFGGGTIGLFSSVLKLKGSRCEGCFSQRGRAAAEDVEEAVRFSTGRITADCDELVERDRGGLGGQSSSLSSKRSLVEVELNVRLNVDRGPGFLVFPLRGAMFDANDTNQINSRVEITRLKPPTNQSRGIQKSSFLRSFLLLHRDRLKRGPGRPRRPCACLQVSTERISPNLNLVAVFLSTSVPRARTSGTSVNQSQPPSGSTAPR